MITVLILIVTIYFSVS